MFCILDEMPLPEEGCTSIKVHAVKLGHTEVHAVWEHGKTKLVATITIAAYKPLKVSLCEMFYIDVI